MPSSPRRLLSFIRSPKLGQLGDTETEASASKRKLDLESSEGSSTHKSPPSSGVSDASLLRLEKRREINRRSQARSRRDKETRLTQLEDDKRSLLEENKRLQDRLEASLSQTSLSSSPSIHKHTHTHAHAHAHAHGYGGLPYSSLSDVGPPVRSVNLEACRQAFLAVLASVCDPHLNTIHAVAQKFAQSRSYAEFIGTSLAHPRPVDRPLNLHIFGNLSQSASSASISPPQQNTSGSEGTNNTPPEPPVEWDMEVVNFLRGAMGPSSLSSGSYIPSPNSLAGPLTVPFLEPPHPVHDHEFDADGVWDHVLKLVDFSRTDAEDLAGQLTEKVRCYGFGPVLMQRDIDDVCESE